METMIKLQKFTSTGASKRAPLVMLHVNIYFCRRPLQKSSLENIAKMSILLYL